MKVTFKCKSNPFLTVPYYAVMNAIYVLDVPEETYYSESGTPVVIKAHKEATYGFVQETGKKHPPFQFFKGLLTLTDEDEIKAFREWVKHGREYLIEETEAE